MTHDIYIPKDIRQKEYEDRKAQLLDRVRKQSYVRAGQEPFFYNLIADIVVNELRKPRGDEK
jgi:hypothetical protein